MNVKLKMQRPGWKALWPAAKGTAPRIGGEMGRYVRNTKGEVVRLGLKPAELMGGRRLPFSEQGTASPTLGEVVPFSLGE